MRGTHVSVWWQSSAELAHAPVATATPDSSSTKQSALDVLMVVPPCQCAPSSPASVLALSPPSPASMLAPPPPSPRGEHVSVWWQSSAELAHPAPSGAANPAPSITHRMVLPSIRSKLVHRVVRRYHHPSTVNPAKLPAAVGLSWIG